MDFALNEHQQDVQRRARAFAASEVAPVAAELDREGRFPPDIIDGAAELGLLGCEHDFVAYVAGLIEISKAWASLGAIVAVHNSLVCYPISRFGTDAQKKKYLSLLTDQKQLGCYAFAEPLGRIRRRRDQNDRRGRRRYVRAQRPQAVRDERPPGARRDRLRAHRSVKRARRAVGVHRRYRHAWLFGRRARNEMLGLRASRNRRPVPARLPRAERESARRTESGIRHRARDCRRRPHRHRGAGGRHWRGVPGRRALPRRRTGSSSAGRSPSSKPFSGWSPTCRPRSTRRAC